MVFKDYKPSTSKLCPQAIKFSRLINEAIL